MSKDSYAFDVAGPCDSQAMASEYDSVIEDIYSSLNNQLLKLLDGMVKSATGRLVELEKKQFDSISYEAGEKQSLERESLRYLLNNSNSIISSFFVFFNEQLKPDVDISTADKADELSLVSHDEMEEMVAITTIHANALNNFGEAISDLSTRVEYLEIKNASIFDSKAVSPKGISEAYRESLNEMDMGTDVNLELFRLFDKEVIQKLEGLYGTLNQIFIDADIMPEIIHVSHDSETIEEAGMSVKPVTTCDEQGNVQTDFIQRPGCEVDSLLSQFTNGEISIPEDRAELPASFYKNPVAQTIDGKKYYQKKDVTRSLNRLQKQILDKGRRSKLNTSEEIKRSLMEDIRQSSEANPDGETREVSVLDERNIDLVGMLFNTIAADKSISEVISELISFLQVPVIKVALNDNKMFQDQAHPTRKVIDLIPEAGRGVTETTDKLYGDIEDVVNNILADRNVDVDSFRKAVDSLHKIMHAEEQSSANNEQEEKRNIIKEHARKVVVAEIRKYSIGKRIPGELKPLILKYWPTLMINRYVKFGNESELWKQSSMLCELMLVSLQPIRNKTQLEQLINQHEVLVEVLCDELSETQQDMIAIDAQLITLHSVFRKRIEENAHLLTSKEGQQETAIDPVVQKQIDEYEAAMARIREQEESVIDKVARLPIYVKPGTWFEIYTGEDRPLRRLKMSVILIETGTIVFVNRKGIKEAEKDAGEFADEIRDGKSRLIADHSTFDAALGNVLSLMAA